MRKALPSVKALAKHPHLLIAYVAMPKKLSKLLEQPPIKVKEAISEYKSVFKKLENKIPSSILTPIRGPVLYTITRLLGPETVVETGVGAGSSSWIILEAMNRNKRGRLYSIDLPNPSILKGKTPGYLVPEELRGYWNIIIGDSTQELPKLLSKLRSVDIFLHDSHHTYEQMTFEYNIAWQYIREDGILLSDDIHWNRAFNDFAKRIRRKAVIFDGIGAIRK